MWPVLSHACLRHGLHTPKRSPGGGAREAAHVPPSILSQERLDALFSKPSIKPPNIILQEARADTKPIAAGTSLEWNIALMNRSTQARELLSIEVPFQPADAPAVFMLKLPLPKPGKSMQLFQNHTHTQGIRFSSRPGCAGTFRTTLIFNFTTWILEHEVAVTVSDAREAIPPPLPPPAAAAPPLRAPPRAAAAARIDIVPAIPPGRNCKLPGAKLLASLGEYRGKASLAAYPLPPDIIDTIEGRRAANFNPWKTKDNYRTRLHELLWLEEAKQRQLTRHYDMVGVEVRRASTIPQRHACLVVPASRLPY
jgi:hypothetical protein